LATKSPKTEADSESNAFVLLPSHSEGASSLPAGENSSYSEANPFSEHELRGPGEENNQSNISGFLVSSQKEVDADGDGRAKPGQAWRSKTFPGASEPPHSLDLSFSMSSLPPESLPRSTKSKTGHEEHAFFHNMEQPGHLRTFQTSSFPDGKEDNVTHQQYHEQYGGSSSHYPRQADLVHSYPGQIDSDPSNTGQPQQPLLHFGQTGTAPDYSEQSGTASGNTGQLGTASGNTGQPGTAPDYSGQPGTSSGNTGQPGTAPDYSRQLGAAPDNTGQHSTAPDYSGQPGTAPNDSRQSGNSRQPRQPPLHSEQPGTAPVYSGQPGTAPADSRQPGTASGYSEQPDSRADEQRSQDAVSRQDESPEKLAADHLHKSQQIKSTAKEHDSILGINDWPQTETSDERNNSGVEKRQADTGPENQYNYTPRAAVNVNTFHHDVKSAGIEEDHKQGTHAPGFKSNQDRGADEPSFPGVRCHGPQLPEEQFAFGKESKPEGN